MNIAWQDLRGRPKAALISPIQAGGLDCGGGEARVPLWEGATAVGNKESPVLPRAPEVVRRKLDGAAPRAELVWEAGRRSQRPGVPAFHQGWFLVTL